MASWRRPKWCGPPQQSTSRWGPVDHRKRFIIVGRCKAEVYTSALHTYTWVWYTFDANGVGGENAEESSLALAKLASMNALIRQATQGGAWHIGQRSLAVLKKLAVLSALQGLR